MTVKEYLAFEEEANDKHEFYCGEVYAMAGGSIPHSAISVAASSAFYNRLSSKGCLVLSSDARVRNTSDTLYTYPDVSVVCGAPDIFTFRGQTLTNPTLIVEVLSPSTRLHDLNRKTPEYKRSDSLQHIVLIDSESIFVQVQSRMPDDTWRVDDYFNIEDQVRFSHWDLTIPLVELYGSMTPPL
jgi:Uma2 family endonuclease